jgi:hypothetical protein
MGDKIVSLRGDAPAGSGIINLYVVEMLENYLERAKRGEIVAMGYVAVLPSRTIQTSWTGAEAGYTHELCSAVATLAYRLQVEAKGGA